MKTGKNILWTTIAVISIGITFTSCGGGDKPAEAKANDASGEGTEPKTESTASADGVGKFVGKEIAGFDAAKATAGKTLFESKCMACHKITDEKVVGPGLKGVTTRRSAPWILNMITNPEEMTKQDPIAKGLLAEHLTQMTNQDVNEEDALSLLNYLRQNDGAK